MILQYVAEKSISVYQEETGTGILRHVYLRQGWHTGELMVCLVVRKPIERQLKGLIERLTTAFPQVKSIVMNCNPARTNVILGEKNVLLWDRKRLRIFFAATEFLFLHMLSIRSIRSRQNDCMGLQRSLQRCRGRNGC